MEHFEPKAAFEFLKRTPDALFIDCRSEMEYLFVGHPVGALHVAWNDGPDWLVNPHFVGQVKRLAGRMRRVGSWSVPASPASTTCYTASRVN